MKSTRRLYQWFVQFPTNTYLTRARTLPRLQKRADAVWLASVADYPAAFPNCPEVFFRLDRPSWYHDVNHTIALGPLQRNFYTLFHELAHALGHGYHGPAFVRCNLDLLARFGHINPMLLAVSAGAWGLEL